MNQLVLSTWCNVCGIKFACPIESGGVLHNACTNCDAPRIVYESHDNHIKQQGYLAPKSCSGDLDGSDADTGSEVLVRCQDCRNENMYTRIIAFRDSLAQEGHLILQISPPKSPVATLVTNNTGRAKNDSTTSLPTITVTQDRGNEPSGADRVSRMPSILYLSFIKHPQPRAS